ncbi:DUF262 domain-containing protein [Streptomyces sp. NPDC020472]|uniref:DUF262 domain-containing protein n=1 Tax=Streptomyces sp. NPDC020472 TaxID=3365075 RepID=UPI0037991122
MMDATEEAFNQASETETEDPAESSVAEASDVFDPDADSVDAKPVRAEESLRYFGADFDVDGLVRRLEKGTFIIPTFEPHAEEGTDGYEGFQRGLVWKKRQMDRFIESILLGYPVPGVFLVELPSRRYLVLDGQQRMTTLHSFVHGKYKTPSGSRKFSLRYVGDEFQGLTYESLPPEARRLFDNTFIQATIVVPKESGGKKAVYALFERINSGGTNLRPQQIRVALFAGATVNFVRELNQNEDWRAIFGPHNRDLKDHELILRALSLAPTARGEQIFKPPMAKYLNEYLESHEESLPNDSEGIKERFAKACLLLHQAAGRDSLRLGGRQVNAAHTDATLAGLMTVLEDGVDLGVEDVRSALSRLTGSVEYRKSVSESTSHSEQVKKRIDLSVKAFSGDSLADEPK